MSASLFTPIPSTSTIDATKVSLPVSAASASTTTSGDQNRGNGNDDAFKTNTASNLYLYTFLATLVLLLLVSTAVIIRSVAHRVRARRALEAAIRNGTYNPPTRLQVANTPKPLFHDARLQDNTTEPDRKGLKLASSTPIMATLIVPMDQLCLPSPAVSSNIENNPGVFSRAYTFFRLSFLSSFIQDLFDELRSHDIHARLQEVHRDDHRSRITQAELAAAVFGGTSSISEKAKPHISHVSVRLAVFIAMPDPANAYHRNEPHRCEGLGSRSSASSSKGNDRAAGVVENVKVEVPHVEFGVADVKLSK